MKKNILGIVLLCIAFSIQAQDVKKKRNTKVTFEVDGVCGMCKKRIETAALKTKGVKFALWNPATHQLNLIMDEHKTEVNKVQKSITEVGHDIVLTKEKKIIAPAKAYDAVHPCCKYREEKVIKDHKETKND
ncbi:cation transporter [uncultured Polaribacter sp.]|uniref:heavy-metal-associated domain-containing protein n=1 Tax=uncultured Polaribacter sp. TaxID=174711 RepID=UPI002613893D|nr:cation transporter [uncultured Polaribacter sp.]